MYEASVGGSGWTSMTRVPPRFCPEAVSGMSASPARPTTRQHLRIRVKIMSVPSYMDRRSGMTEDPVRCWPEDRPERGALSRSGPDLGLLPFECEARPKTDQHKPTRAIEPSTNRGREGQHLPVNHVPSLTIQERAGAAEDGVEHPASERAREGVLLARVVGGQQPHAIGEAREAAVAEAGAGLRHRLPGDLSRPQVGVEAELPQRHDHAHLRQQLQLADE